MSASPDATGGGPPAPGRVRCRELSEHNGDALLCGRVLRCTDASLTLADESGSCVVAWGADLAQPRPGDIVELVVVCHPNGWRGGGLKVLTPYRRSLPFPSPGADYYRLMAGEPHRVERLRQRARLLKAVRRFFDERAYVEIEAPLRVRHPGLEPHLVAAPAGDGRFLITSPEYQLKRLLTTGLERIYSLGKCWRDEEEGPHHLGEFTMLEWYQAHVDSEALMAETEALLGCCGEALGDTSLPHRFERITVADACQRYAGVALKGITEVGQLAEVARGAAFDVEEGEGFEEILSRILVERVEPALAGFPAVFLHDYPAPVAALARLRSDDPTVAERFELYLGGVELANAFAELTDPDEQHRRFVADQEQRHTAGLPVHAIDERFIEALREGIPPCAGIALGVDRLLAALVGASNIADTVAFTDAEL